jgi:hypothetical protein
MQSMLIVTMCITPVRPLIDRSVRQGSEAILFSAGLITGEAQRPVANALSFILLPHAEP